MPSSIYRMSESQEISCPPKSGKNTLKGKEPAYKIPAWKFTNE
jgi:hypothetical protein